MSKRCCKGALEEESALGRGPIGAEEQATYDDLLGGFAMVAGVGVGVMALVVFLIWAFVA